MATNSTFLLNVSDSSRAFGVFLEVPGSQVELYAEHGISYLYRSAMLSDGRVVIPCYDGGGPVIVKCFAAGDLTTIDWSYSISGSSYAYTSDISILSNGNILVAWVDYSSNNPSFAILDSSGASVKVMTDASPGGPGFGWVAEEENHAWITILNDGGFALTWRANSSTVVFSSLWEVDGTLRQGVTRTDGNYDNQPIQMPSGGVGVASGLLGTIGYDDPSYSNWASITNLSEQFDYVDIGQGGVITHSAKLDTWTDKVAFVYASGSNEGGIIRGSILNDEHDFVIEDKIIISDTEDYKVMSLLSLPDGTFLLQATNIDSAVAPNSGMFYWILDETLDIVSGPTQAFTGLTSGMTPYGSMELNVKGSAVGEAPVEGPDRPMSIFYNISSRGNIRGKAKEGFVRPTVDQFFGARYEEILSP